MPFPLLIAGLAALFGLSRPRRAAASQPTVQRPPVPETRVPQSSLPGPQPSELYGPPDPEAKYGPPDPSDVFGPPVPRGWTPPAAAAPFLPIFRDAAIRYGVPEPLLMRQAWQESRFNPRAFNASSNAKGIMQIIDVNKAGQRLHPDTGFGWRGGAVDPFNPEQAIPYAAWYMRRLYDVRGRSWARALASYNWGIGSVDRTINARGDAWISSLPRETKNYVTQILGDIGYSLNA